MTLALSHLGGIRLEHHWMADMAHVPPVALATFLRTLAEWECAAARSDALALLSRGLRSLPLPACLRAYEVFLSRRWVDDVSRTGRLPHALIAYLFQQAFRVE